MNDDQVKMLKHLIQFYESKIQEWMEKSKKMAVHLLANHQTHNNNHHHHQHHHHRHRPVAPGWRQYDTPW